MTEKVGIMESERAENTILHVLQQHHIQQKIQLEEQFRSEIKVSQDVARARISEQRQQEKEELIAAHEEVSHECLNIYHSVEVNHTHVEFKQDIASK